MVAICTLNSIGIVPKFHMSDFNPYLLYHVDFHMKVVHGTNKTIRRMVIDEGASTCVMAIS